MHYLLVMLMSLLQLFAAASFALVSSRVKTAALPSGLLVKHPQQYQQSSRLFSSKDGSAPQQQQQQQQQQHSAEIFTFVELEEYAKASGLRLKSVATGPVLRIEAFPICNNEDEPIGYLTAFLRPFPFGLFHLDTIQVKNRRQNLGYQRKGWTIEGPGISFIMGSYALRWAWDRGCRRTELLAVKDTEQMHAVLVRLYESFGFKTVREVGDEQSSIQDRLTWGAVGTLMEMVDTTHTHTHTYTHKHTHIHTHTHIYIYIYTYIYTHPHTHILPPPPPLSKKTPPLSPKNLFT